MKAFQVSQTIAASPEEVWAVLVDGERYPEWDPGVERISGTIEPDGRITVVSKRQAGRAFPATVTAFEPGKRMVWTGKMPLGLFKGERAFSLAPTEDGGTAFTMREEFTGLLAAIIYRSIPDLQPEFETFADGLKRRAEERATPATTNAPDAPAETPDA